MKKILFISYFFEPYPAVGAKRVSYWANHISEYGFSPIVVTATEQVDKKKYPVHVVPYNDNGSLFSFLIKDQGFIWKKKLKSFFDSFNEKVDYILISGGPFLHFGSAGYLKKKYPEAKIMFDYRDPFAINPYFNDNIIKKELKKSFERKFNRLADRIITVNPYCAKLIQTNKPVDIIDNGFDETVLSVVKKNAHIEPGTLILAGKFYGLKQATPLINTIKQNPSLKFYHYGIKSPDLPYDDNKIRYEGMVNYTQVLEAIYTKEVALLLTNGYPFQSTTKVFDYMALNKKILIITEGEPQTGSIYEITKNYPNVAWSINKEKSITTAIDQLLNKPPQPFDASSFSRKNSLKKLVALLNEC